LDKHQCITAPTQKAGFRVLKLVLWLINWDSIFDFIEPSRLEKYNRAIKSGELKD